MYDEQSERLWDGRERRSWPRYTPDSSLPVMFQHPRANGLGAGHIVDLGGGGCHVLAPPTVTTPIRWGEPLVLTLTYCERTRDAGLEGLVIEAVVVEARSSSRALEMRLRFVKPISSVWAERLVGLLANAA